MDSMENSQNFRELMIIGLVKDEKVSNLIDYYLMSKVHNFSILVECNS